MWINYPIRSTEQIRATLSQNGTLSVTDETASRQVVVAERQKQAKKAELDEGLSWEKYVSHLPGKQQSNIHYLSQTIRKQYQSYVSCVSTQLLKESSSDKELGEALLVVLRGVYYIYKAQSDVYQKQAEKEKAQKSQKGPNVVTITYAEDDASASNGNLPQKMWKQMQKTKTQIEQEWNALYHKGMLLLLFLQGYVINATDALMTTQETSTIVATFGNDQFIKQYPLTRTSDVQWLENITSTDLANASFHQLCTHFAKQNDTWIDHIKDVDVENDTLALASKILLPEAKDNATGWKDEFADQDYKQALEQAGATSSTKSFADQVVVDQRFNKDKDKDKDKLGFDWVKEKVELLALSSFADDSAVDQGHAITDPDATAIQICDLLQNSSIT
ncbi:hypothetical protein RFI_09638, partial [Reticulomyxa filosa]